MNCTSEEESVSHHPSSFDPPCTDVTSKCSNGTNTSVSNGIDHISDVVSSKSAMVNGHTSTSEHAPEIEVENHKEDDKSEINQSYDNSPELRTVNENTSEICKDTYHCDKITLNITPKCNDKVNDDSNSEITPKCPENTASNSAPQCCENVNEIVPICGDNNCPDIQEKLSETSPSCNDNSSKNSLDSEVSSFRTISKADESTPQCPENGCDNASKYIEISTENISNFDKNCSETISKITEDNGKEITTDCESSNPEESRENNCRNFSAENVTKIEEISGNQTEILIAKSLSSTEEKHETEIHLENIVDENSTSVQNLESISSQISTEITEETNLEEEPEVLKPENVNSLQECNSKNNCETPSEDVSSKLNSTVEINSDKSSESIQNNLEVEEKIKIDATCKENQNKCSDINSQLKSVNEIHNSNSADSKQINGDDSKQIISIEERDEKSSENQLEEKRSEVESVPGCSSNSSNSEKVCKNISELIEDSCVMPSENHSESTKLNLQNEEIQDKKVNHEENSVPENYTNLVPESENKLKNVEIKLVPSNNLNNEDFNMKNEELKVQVIEELNEKTDENLVPESLVDDKNLKSGSENEQKEEELKLSEEISSNVVGKDESEKVQEEKLKISVENSHPADERDSVLESEELQKDTLKSTEQISSILDVKNLVSKSEKQSEELKISTEISSPVGEKDSVVETGKPQEEALKNPEENSSNLDDKNLVSENETQDDGLKISAENSSIKDETELVLENENSQALECPEENSSILDDKTLVSESETQDDELKISAENSSIKNETELTLENEKSQALESPEENTSILDDKNVVFENQKQENVLKISTDNSVLEDEKLQEEPKENLSSVDNKNLVPENEKEDNNLKISAANSVLESEKPLEKALKSPEEISKNLEDKNLVSENEKQEDELKISASIKDGKDSVLENEEQQEKALKSPEETSVPLEGKDLASASEKAEEDCDKSEELNTSGESVATSSSTDKTKLLSQTKPFHIPLDDNEVIEYLKKQTPRFGRPRRRKRDNTNAMLALEALRSKGWKPGRRKAKVEEEVKDASEEEPKVKRKYNKRKLSITEIDLSPRKLRRVPARLANDSELRQAAARTPNPESPKTTIKNDITPIAPEIIDPSTLMSDSSMENIDPLATTDTSLDVPETCEEANEGSLDTGAVKIVDPTQFLISKEPIKKKLGRPRKDTTQIVPITTDRVTRNIKRPILFSVKRKYIKKSDLKNYECDKKSGKFKSNDMDLSKSSIESTSPIVKKKMGRPRKIITDDLPIVPKRKYIKKKYPDGSPKQLGQKKYISKMIKNQGHFKCTKEALKKLKLKSCHVVLEKKVALAKKFLADVKEKKKLGRPKKIRDENEEPKKLGRPRKSDAEKAASPGIKKPRKLKSMSPEDGKIKKKMGRPKKLSLSEDVRVSPVKIEQFQQGVDKETEELEHVTEDTPGEDTKPCKILLDSSKVTKYLTTQKKRKREETHAEIIHKRFKAEMERLQNLAADQELRPAPPSKVKKSYVSCDICQKTFVNDNQYRLNRHMAAVHNSEPFCKRCNTMFKDRTGFYSHVKKCKSMYSNGSPPKPGEPLISLEPLPPLIPPNPEDLKPGLHCPYCYKTFCSKFSTERHMRIMHPDKIFCKFCLEPFQDINQYPDHLLGCPERPKRDGKLVKIKKEIAKKLGTLVGKPIIMTSTSSSSNITTIKTNNTVAVSTSSFSNSIEFDAYNNSSNEKDYGYSEFYSDMDVSSTSYSLENSYSQHEQTWDESKTSEWEHESEIEVSEQSQQQQQQIQQQHNNSQQNLAMLEFMPAVNEPEFDYVHSESIQHVEDDKVYHLL